jgi:oligoendopeptidase F
MSYTTLKHHADTADHEIAASMQHVEEQVTEIGTLIAFIDIEWAEIDDLRAEALMNHEALAFCRGHLEGMREYGPHQLSEAEERLDAERSLTGASAWARLYDELEADITCQLTMPGGVTNIVPLEEALSLLASPDAAVRQAAHAAVTAGLEPGMRTRAFIYNTIMLDRYTTDKVREFPTWVSAWNMENDTADETVEALISAVKSRYDIAQRWYRLKAQLLGAPLQDKDRYASIDETFAEISWEQGSQIVLDAYAKFSPLMARIVQEFYDKNWIDAGVRANKSSGAFCDYTVAAHNPYLMLNWTSRRSDVLTLAHELGHGIHAYLSRPQGYYHQETGMAVAETASVFGETLTFASMLDECSDPSERLGLLAGQVDDAINTVFRQAALFSFEERAHTIRREEGELSVDELAEVWLETQGELYGDSVELTADYGNWWSYISHFFATPGYVSAYPFGQLLALSVYAKYLAEPEGFELKLLSMLHAGGSKSADELAEMVGCDLSDPDFWSGGLGIIEQQVVAAEDAARQAGRIA